VIEGLVTTVVPVRNRAGLLPDALLSALGQTYDRQEIVVVDDASTDQTWHVAQEIASASPRVRVLRTERQMGPGGARQMGLAVGRGEFVQYLDSDDLLLPKKLEVQVAALRAHPECGASYGITDWTDLQGRSIPGPGLCGTLAVDRPFPEILRGRLWDTQGPLFRRSLLDRAGPWARLRAEEDWEYDCRVGSVGTQLHHVPEVVATTRRHGHGHLSRFGGRGGRLRDRARARERILGHARRAGCPEDGPEMRHFGRALFLLSRQCGAEGLRAEAERLWNLAREIDAGPGRDLETFRSVARATGWRAAGVLAATYDRLRPGALR
jgi:hypothetical protein